MGGKAFQEVGAIHLSEIGPTFQYIKELLNLPADCKMLGSCGKKTFSGDIDIAYDLPPEDRQEFFLKLKKHFGDQVPRKLGSCYSVPVKIQHYSSILETERPRTGYVQCDFVFGNVEWLDLFYHSSSAGHLKGAHRNVALSTLAGLTDRIEHTDEQDNKERCTDVTRYKWSSTKGLLRVRRRSVRNKRTGNWQVAQKEEELGTPIYDKESICKILFPGLDVSLCDKYTDTAESVIESVKTVYRDNPELLQTFYKKLAKNFLMHHDIGNKDWKYPEEIQGYVDEINGVHQ